MAPLDIFPRVLLVFIILNIDEPPVQFGGSFVVTQRFNRLRESEEKKKKRWK